MQQEVDPTDLAAIRKDLERYAWLIEAANRAWFDFWLIAVAGAIGGVGVFVFSGETWALALGVVMFAAMFMRTARVINRFDGELLFLHRKWIRRGWFFTSDGHAAEALPHEPVDVSGQAPDGAASSG